jgi:5-deoxy-D-glucuronate isomerase
MKAYPILVAALLLGCATAADLVNIGDDAWRLTTIDNTEADAVRVGTTQAIEICGKRGKEPVIATTRTANDMPARYVSTMEFQCTARGSSPDAQAEARMRGYQRDCAIAGFTLGSPENLKCATDVSAKANPKPGTGR